ncbi:MAG: site-2 protease family protein [Dehalococcoidia bacterium]|nr:site-2 protease family protein [Dehalococcoidia bacterium]
MFSMLVGLSFHEFSHALAANALGDRTAARAGRLTLNPRAHLDPLGSLLILFVGFGWAKPTPVNPMNTANPKRSLALISLAGPASNLVIAALAALPLRLGLVSTSLDGGTSLGGLVALFLSYTILLNVLLAVFNFLPIAPLDGFKIAVGILPKTWSRSFARLEPWGPGILFGLIALPWITNGRLNLLSDVMTPIRDLLLATFLGNGAGL